MSDGPQSITPLGGGRFLVSDGRRQQLAYAVADGARAWVFVNGEIHDTGEARSRSAQRRSSAGEMALASPMPATVVEVKVAPGAQVETGDVLVTLEAMKMELSIAAPRAGTVKAVACRPGELVQPGVALVELE